MDRTFIIQPESGLQFDWKAIAANPSAHHEPQMNLVAYKALYINKIAQARARGMEPVLVSLPIMDENRYFAHITSGMSLQERKNLLYWLGGKTERLRNIHAIYNLALFRAMCSHCGCHQPDARVCSLRATTRSGRGNAFRSRESAGGQRVIGVGSSP